MQRALPVLLFALFVMGSGPCDWIQPEEEADAGDSGLDCGEETCVNSLVVEVIRADNEYFYDGVYDFEVAVPDGAAYSLECYFAGYGSGFDCSYGDVAILGAAIDGACQTIQITLLDAPASATFTVMYNDWAIGERTFTPAYEEVHPNGPQCEPVCYKSEETMAVESW